MLKGSVCHLTFVLHLHKGEMKKHRVGRADNWSGEGIERDKNRVWDPKSLNTVWFGLQTWHLINRKCQLIKDFTWHHQTTAIRSLGKVPKITLRGEKQYEPI